MSKDLRRHIPEVLTGLCLVTLAALAAWAVSEAVGLRDWLGNLQAAAPGAAGDAVAAPYRFLVTNQNLGALADFLRVLSLMVATLCAMAAFLMWRLSQVTSRFNRALAMARESRDRYRFLAEAPPSVGMVRIGLQTNEFVDANRTVLNMLGLARSEFVGRPLDSFVHPDDREEFQRHVDRLRSGERTLELTARMKSRNDETLDIQWHLARVQTNGPQAEAVAILTDVSARRRAELEKAEKERLQGVLEMAGAAAHELNQPVQVILAYASMLSQKTGPEDPNYRFIAKLKEEADRMERIGKKIATISQYKVKPYVGDTKIIDIDQASSPVTRDGVAP